MCFLPRTKFIVHGTTVELAFVTFRELSFWSGKQVSVRANWQVKYDEENYVLCSTTKKEKSSHTGRFLMHLLATKNKYRSLDIS